MSSITPVSENTTTTTVTDDTKKLCTESLDSYNRLKEQWDKISDADKAIFQPQFTNRIVELLTQAKTALEKLQAALDALDETIDIDALIKQIQDLIQSLDITFNGQEGFLSFAERVLCLQELLKNKALMGEISYNSLLNQLNTVSDPNSPFSLEGFKASLNNAKLSYIYEGEAEKAFLSAQTRKDQVSQSLSMKVIQAKNQFKEIDIENQASANLHTRAEFNPMLKNLRDDGTWIQNEKLEQQKRAEAFREEQIRLARAQQPEIQPQDADINKTDLSN